MLNNCLQQYCVVADVMSLLSYTIRLSFIRLFRTYLSSTLSGVYMYPFLRFDCFTIFLEVSFITMFYTYVTRKLLHTLI